VLTSGIIQEAKNAEELCGVIAHELAHMEQNHVMKKLGKEIGFSVLMTVTSGGGAEVVRQILHLLSSTAYDRELEEEADRLAVDYLAKAGIDPLPFSDFMFRIANGEEGNTTYFDWISTHPNSEERAGYIFECAKAKDVEETPVLSQNTWIEMRNRIQ
jgi:predicted Zn-dependent protease